MEAVWCCGKAQYTPLLNVWNLVFATLLIAVLPYITRATAVFHIEFCKTYPFWVYWVRRIRLRPCLAEVFMHSATFLFDTLQFDNGLHRLDARSAAADVEV